MRFIGPAAAFALVAISLAACGGGGGGGSSSAPPVNQTATPTNAPTSTPTPTPTSSATAAPQVIKIALPSGNMGAITDPSFGLVGGYTENTSSQVLAFVPGAQVMLQNVASGTPHTFNIISTTGFSGAPSSGSSAGGSTIASGFASGTISAGSSIGPFTLSAGTYYFGCYFHYSSNTMRDVVIVAAGATPGPQATPVPNPTSSGGGNPCPGGYC